MPGCGKNDLFQSFDRNFDFWTSILKKSDIDFLIVFLDLTKLLDVSPIGFYKLLLSKIYRNVLKVSEDDTQKEEIVNIYKEAVNNSDLFVVYSAVEDLVKIVTRELNLKLCIIIHDFSTLSEFNKQFFNSIKALRNVDLWKITFAFSSDKDPLKIFTSSLLDELYNLFLNKRILLELPKEEDAFLIMEEWERECGYKIPLKVRKRLFEITNGHPGYMKSINQIYQDTKKDICYLDNNNLELIANEPVIKARSEKFWIKLDKNYQDFLIEFVRNPSLKYDKKMNYLENVGIVINGKNKRLFSKLLEYYIRNDLNAIPAEEIPIKTGLYIDQRSKSVFIDGKRIEKEPTNSEFKILNLLYKKKGEIVSREELAEAIWGKNVIDKYSDWAIDRTVSRIRKKINDSARNPKYIKTIKGRGLRLI